jgi:hypothetical protein
MPAKTKRHGHGDLTPQQLEYLISGCGLDELLDDIGESSRPAFENLALAKNAWDANKDWILKNRGRVFHHAGFPFCFEHGQRPWAWWKFETKGDLFAQYEKLPFQASWNRQNIEARLLLRYGYLLKEEIQQIKWSRAVRLKSVGKNEENQTDDFD